MVFSGAISHLLGVMRVSKIIAEVQERMGVCPSFFLQAVDSPGQLENLWRQTQQGYLDNPLPPVLKEKLIVYVARSCGVPYLTARHCGFLLGRGFVSGDSNCSSLKVEEVVELLRKPLLSGAQVKRLREECPSVGGGASDLAHADGAMENWILECGAALYLRQEVQSELNGILRGVIGNAQCEQLLDLLAYIRTAHFWLEAHPKVRYESDLEELLEELPELAKMVRSVESVPDVDNVADSVGKVAVFQRAEQDLRLSEERYRSLVSVITDIPWSTDAEGRFVEPQPAWSAYTGQSWETYRDFGWETALYPEDRESIRRLWLQSLHSKCDYKAEGRLWHSPSQQYRHFEARATPLLDASGDVREWVGACKDVHESKETEERLRSLSESLSHQVEAQTRDFHEAQAQLFQSEKMSALGTLISGVSHELFNPLMGVLNIFEYAVEKTTSQPKLQAQLRKGVDGTRRCIKLTEDLLTFARKESTGSEVCDVADCVLKVRELTAPEVLKTGITVAEQVLPNLPPVLMSGLRLEQVLLNLFLNARDAMEHRGERRIEIRAHMSERAKYVIVEMEDSGPGISAEDAGKVFKPFYTTKPPGKGSGLGLSICQSIVESYGGTIKALPSLSGGAIFQLELLIADRAGNENDESGS